MTLLFATLAAIAAENATREISEKKNKALEQGREKNTSVTQRVTEEAKETVAEAKEEDRRKEQPGIEATFAAAGLSYSSS